MHTFCTPKDVSRWERKEEIDWNKKGGVTGSTYNTKQTIKTKKPYIAVRL